MSKWLLLLATAMFALGAQAGPAEKVDPHHGLMGKGCDSKDKVAKLKERFGEDYFVQHPKSGHFSIEDAREARKAWERKRLLEESI